MLTTNRAIEPTARADRSNRPLVAKRFQGLLHGVSGHSTRVSRRSSKRFPEGFRRVSGGIPEGFRGIPGGFKGIPALEYVFRPYETKVQASEIIRPSALIKIKETFEAQESWPPRRGPARGLPAPTPPGLFPPSRILPRCRLEVYFFRAPEDFYYFPG